MLFETPSATTAGAGRSVATLEDYLEAIRNRKLWVVGGVVLGLGLSVYLTKDRIQSYESAAAVLLNPSPVGRTDGGLTAPNLEREAKVAVSEEVTASVLTNLGVDPAVGLPGSVSASFTPQSDVITLTATANEATQAATIANGYANAYVALRIADQGATWDALIAGVQKNVNDFDAAIIGANLQVGEIDQQLTELRKQTPGTDRDNTITDLSTLRSAALGQIATLQNYKSSEQTKLSDLQRSQSSSPVAAKLLSEATAPSAPVGLSRKVFIGAGLFAGLLLGIIAAFLRERLDRKASGAREIELALGGRVIGSVPKFSFLYRRGQWALVMANGKTGISLQRAREAYRRLRASMLFLARTDNARTIVVTSTKPREGKSTTSANLALALALGGTKTVLVSADLRKPSLEGLFGIRNDRGLSTYLTGKSDTVHTETIEGIEALTIIPAGPEIPNPGELLGSPRFARLVELLVEHFDMIVIDSPPLGAAADSLAAAESADGVLVVVDGNRTDTNELLAIRRELDRAGAKLLGAVMNREAVKFKVPFLNRGYGYYGTADGGAATSVAPDDDTSPTLTNPSGRRSVGRRATDEELAARAIVAGQPRSPRAERSAEPVFELDELTPEPETIDEPVDDLEFDEPENVQLESDTADELIEEPSDDTAVADDEDLPNDEPEPDSALVELEEEPARPPANSHRNLARAGAKPSPANRRRRA
jgi:capsular exopolysaccharide synthesis family protein